MSSLRVRLASCLTVVVGCGGGLVAVVPPAPAAPVPGSGSAADVLRLRPADRGLAVRRVPLGGDRAARPLRTAPVDLAALTWTGPAGALRLRSHHPDGWSAWRTLPELEDGPDRGTAGPDRTARRGTDLTWLGGADGVEVAVRGRRPADLTLVLMAVADEGAARRPAAAPAARTRSPLRPPILGRGAWGADPRLRDGTPTYNRTIQQVHVHHTVNGNRYRAGQVPALIRGMYRYHTVDLGWSDIGYNFLVDRFGRTWTGRAGGAARAVRGAHTLGFNDTSTGVAVIGGFERHRPSQRVLTALVRLAAWKLHRYGRDPRGRARVWSHGSDRYPAGRWVRLPVIDGHRDTNQTACPGAQLYRLLPGVRRRAAQRIGRLG